MFKKFAAFWIENPKLTWLFIIATFLIGIFSWYSIPKQYNPDIVVPAFQITIPTPGFSSKQTQQLVTTPLENILAGLE
ncbi:MAG: efflux RND transporter permease subunit [Candidatus Peribacteria bacterium]|nr:MAG: efflux RND transporter permease subunit [Candidatus Peribacteria bacterium]